MAGKKGWTLWETSAFRKLYYGLKESEASKAKSAQDERRVKLAELRAAKVQREKLASAR